jgi:hypothetical protein
MSFTFPKQIIVPLRWTTVTASDHEDWPFIPGGRISRALRERIMGPRVYRFYFCSSDGSPWCYIGESEKFERRCGEYIRTLERLRKPKPARESTLQILEKAWKELQSDAEVRVAAKIQNAELDGIRIELQTIDFDEFVFNRVSISPDSCSNPFQRKAVESLAVLDSEAVGMNMLNSGRDVNAKWFSNLLKRKAAQHNATQK